MENFLQCGIISIFYMFAMKHSCLRNETPGGEPKFFAFFTLVSGLEMKRSRFNFFSGKMKRPQ